MTYRIPLLRLGACLTASLMLLSSLAPVIGFASELVRSRSHRQAGGGDYTDTPGAVDYGTYPLVDPVTRGYFYSTDDLAAFNISDQVEAGAAAMPTDTGYVSGGTNDTGDDMVLDGRPAALPRNQSTGGGGGNEPLLVILNSLLASTQPSCIEPKPSSAGAQPSLEATLLSASAPSAAASSTLAARQGAGDTGTGSGVTGVGQSGPRAGEAFPWEGYGPGGGSTAAPAYLNTQTGNLMTVMPIVGWKIPGGMNLNLTMYHNSQDNLDIGWGMNWRSSFDMRAIYTGTNYTSKAGKYIVSYPSGKRLVFTNPNPLVSNVYYPPTGFYDVLSRSTLVGSQACILRTRDQITYAFDLNGFLISIWDRYRNTINITRNSATHAISSVSDSYGNKLTFTYVGTEYYGHYTTVVTSTGNTYTFSIPTQAYNNSIWVLRSVTFPAPISGGQTSTETFYYDLSAGIAQEVSRDGQAYGFHYDSAERELLYSYPVPFYTNPFSPTGNNALTYTYSYGGTSTTLTDPYGKTVIDNYDGGTLHSEVDQAGYSQTFWWDLYYNCNQYKSARGYTSYFTFDNYGNMLTSQDPRQYAASVKQKWSWNSWNDVLTATDTRGAVTHYNRDPSSGVVLNVVDGLNNTVVTNTYTTTGQLATTSTEGGTTTVSYDTSNRAQTIQTPDQTYTVSYPATYLHVLPNLPATVTDGPGNVTSYGYDLWGRATSVSRSADSASASVTLDLMNRMTDAYDWDQHHFHYQFDAIGRLTGAPGINGLVWWDVDRLAGVYDGNNHLRQYAYTVRGEVKGLTLADGSVEVYQFDGDGDQTTRTNALSQKIQYGFDSTGNLTSTTYPDNSAATVAYDYDGRTSSMSDLTGTTGWTYDNADRLTNFNSPQGNLSYGYDQWGRRTGLSVGSTQTLQYNYTGTRLTSINQLVLGETTTWTYDGFGRPQSQTNSNGTVATYGYDGLSRLASLTHTTGGGSLILSESYTYDSNSNPSSKTSNSVTTNYFYDFFGHLTDEKASSNPNVNTAGDFHYGYDGAGNRTARILYGSYTDSYAYDAGDKLQNVQRNAGAGNLLLKTYQYDLAGRTTQVTNQVTGVSTSLTYDYEDRISTISTPGMTTNSYAYNALDARVAKTDSGGVFAFLRDGGASTDAVLSDGQNSYVPGVSRHSSGGTVTYHQNRIGSNSAETDATGTVKGTRTHDAFGNLIAQTGAPSGPFGYAGTFGYQEDRDSGLKLLGHRYYDPSVGRFITRDPAMQGLNWYSYCDSSPLASVDRSGLMSDGVPSLDSVTSNPAMVKELAEEGIKVGGKRFVPTAWDRALGWVQAGAKFARRALEFLHILKTARRIFHPEPRTLEEQIVMDGARAGMGTQIMDKMDDPRYEETHRKMQYTVKVSAQASSIGKAERSVTVHYMQLLEDPEIMEAFKFVTDTAGTPSMLDNLDSALGGDLGDPIAPTTISRPPGQRMM